MKITILTTGSRGDVQPYIALALGLQVAGHRVRLATFEGFRDFVTSYGVGFSPVTPLSSVLTASQDWNTWQRTGANTVRYVGYFGRIVRLAQAALEQILVDYWKACQGADVVISSMSGLGGPYIAEKLGVSHYWALLQPVSRTRMFPHFLSPPRLRLGPVFNLFSYLAAERIYWQLFKGPINRWRQQTLDLPSAAQPGYHRLLGQTHHPVVYGYSAHVLPRPVDWQEHDHVTGYWFLDRTPDWRPPSDLRAFLESGPPPVYIGLGSMKARSPSILLKITLDALAQLQMRAVLMMGGGESRQAELPESVFCVDSIPHDWLFPKVAVVVHHGGIGTTASALRAGTPSIGIPHFFDQPFWSRRIAELGVGPQPVFARQLSAERLAASIHVAMTPAMQTRAAQLGEQIGAENGVECAVAVLNQYFKGYSRTSRPQLSS